MNHASRPVKVRKKHYGIDSSAAQVAVLTILLLTVIGVATPVVITFFNSLKTNYEASTSIWALPETPLWSNWAVGLKGMGRNMLNSIIVCLVSTVGIVFLGSLSAYVFVRHSFPGKEIIFFSIIALMIVPGVLSLTPQYVLMINLGLKNTWWALILPYISGGQVGAIFLFRTFLSQQPKELFEAAKIDGAGEFTLYARISLPLALPVLALQAVASFTALYNDYLWPMLVIDQEQKQTLMAVLKPLAATYSGPLGQQGISYAMYLLSGIPLVIVTILGLKHFINGEMASGLKL